MVDCVESVLSAEVMVGLYEFDLEKHLNFWYSTENVIGLYEHDKKRIVSFISWFTTHDQVRVLVNANNNHLLNQLLAFSVIHDTRQTFSFIIDRPLTTGSRPNSTHILGSTTLMNFSPLVL